MAHHETVVSVTQFKRYQTCPRQWFYGNHPDIPKKTDYSRLCGIAVHQHIRQLHQPPKEPRPFFFKTKRSALGAWYHRWHREVDKATQQRLMRADEKATDNYFLIGSRCVSKYWDANINLPRPLETEKTYREPLDVGGRRAGILVGVVDQVRSVSLEWIRRHRPELVVNDRLDETFSPVVIVDFKTGEFSYDVEELRKKSQRNLEREPTIEEQVFMQYELHEDLQPTAYTFLYEKTTGKKPVGVLWNHLRSGALFFTFRDERDYHTLFETVDHFLNNLAAQSFPKHVGYQCSRCDYLLPCREDRPFLLSKPTSLSEGGEQCMCVPTIVKKDPVQQLTLGLQQPRAQHSLPIVTPSSEERPIVLRNLPWDEKRKYLQGV